MISTNHNIRRVLLATIQDCGLCPCPRCLVPKARLDHLGWAQDMSGHLQNAHTNFADLVSRAWDCIYNSGFAVMSAGVECMLEPFSIVPTMVCFLTSMCSFKGLTALYQECFRRKTWFIWFQLTSNARRGPAA